MGLAGQLGEGKREEKQGVCAEVFLAQWAAQRGRGRSNNDEETALLRGAKGTRKNPAAGEATRLCYQSREADSGRLGSEEASPTSQLLFATQTSRGLESRVHCSLEQRSLRRLLMRYLLDH